MILDEILKNYFSAHKELIATEQLNDDSVMVSFPLHFVGNHRIEVAVSRASDGLFVISDVGRTISELKDYGYAVSPSLLSRMAHIAKPASVRIVSENLLMDCPESEVGSALHSFVEVAKTIGDAYLAFHVKSPTEKRLIEEVKERLDETEIPYRTSHKVHGKIDAHPVDFYMPPNGHPGLALKVLGGFNTHTTAQVWYFKCQDIRGYDSRVKVGIVYDTEESNWSSKSETILRDIADFAMPSNEISGLPDLVKYTVS
jgi:hypothetical protein